MQRVAETSFVGFLIFSLNFLGSKKDSYDPSSTYLWKMITVKFYIFSIALIKFSVVELETDSHANAVKQLCLVDFREIISIKVSIAARKNLFEKWSRNIREWSNQIKTYIQQFKCGEQYNFEAQEIVCWIYHLHENILR